MSSFIHLSGIRVDPLRQLFIVDVARPGEPTSLERRVFQDLLAAAIYIGRRAATLRALFTPDWASADEVFLETVEAAFAFEPSNTYLLKFKGESTALWIRATNEDVPLDACEQIYPVPGS
nr:hypothetical protein [uncultured Albidiferax sp.]